MNRCSPQEEFAAAALPALLHRMRNATQALVSVRALVDEAGGAALPASCGRALASAADDAHELGWLFGLVSGCLGADVLLGRCERRGLASALELARHALAREERALSIVGPVPELQAAPPGAPAPWRVAASVATIAWRAGSTLPAGGASSIGFARAERGFTLRGDRGAADATFSGAAARAIEWLPGSEIAAEGDAWELRLPVEWLSAPR
jgi:hypothetical protein